MASPQKENGFVAVANEIYEALGKTRISGEARQVFDVIIRKTYGFRKKEDRISLSQFTLASGLRRPTVCRAINKLLKMNLITQKDNQGNKIYSIQKDFDHWIPLPKKITLPKSVTQKDNASLPKKRHTKDNTTKDNNDDADASSPLKKKMNDFSDYGEPVIDVDTGHIIGFDVKKVKKDGKNKIAIRIVHAFSELCKKNVGIMPIFDMKAYKMALFAINTGGLTEKQAYDLFDEWFGLGQPDEHVIQITRALSSNQINSYKARNGK